MDGLPPESSMKYKEILDDLTNIVLLLLTIPFIVLFLVPYLVLCHLIGKVKKIT